MKLIRWCLSCLQCTSSTLTPSFFLSLTILASCTQPICPEVQPQWSAFRTPTYGFVHLNLKSASVAEWWERNSNILRYYLHSTHSAYLCPNNIFLFRPQYGDAKNMPHSHPYLYASSLALGSSSRQYQGGGGSWTVRSLSGLLLAIVQTGHKW